VRPLIVATFIWGCALDASTDDGSGSGKGDVWGTDDRMERYELSTQQMRDVAKSSLATVIARDLRIDESRGVWSANDAPTLQTDQRLCDGQRFADQPVLADCSATLIAPDIALTAGHCFEASDCSGILLVLDYAYDAPARDPMSVAHALPTANVFRCAEMLAWKFTADEDPAFGHDYALLRLDRPAGRPPVRIDWDSPRLQNEPIYVMGYPAGIPLKISPGKILDAVSSPIFFEHDADVLGGTSGGGVFDRHGALRALHSGSSGKRYVPGPSGSCNVVAECGANATCPNAPVAYDVRSMIDELTPELRALIGAP
jgi:hypothetical protein